MIFFIHKYFNINYNLMIKMNKDIDLNNLKKTINDKSEKKNKNIKKEKKNICIGSKHIVVKEDAFKDITEKNLMFI